MLGNDKNTSTKWQYHTHYAMTKIYVQNYNTTHATQWQKYMHKITTSQTLCNDKNTCTTVQNV